jgi:hypothetical protein
MRKSLRLIIRIRRGQFFLQLPLILLREPPSKRAYKGLSFYLIAPLPQAFGFLDSQLFFMETNEPWLKTKKALVRLYTAITLPFVGRQG